MVWLARTDLLLTRPIFTSPVMSINKTADTGATINHPVCSKSRYTVTDGVECWLLEALDLTFLNKATVQ